MAEDQRNKFYTFSKQVRCRYICPEIIWRPKKESLARSYEERINFYAPEKHKNFCYYFKIIELIKIFKYWSTKYVIYMHIIKIRLEVFSIVDKGQYLCITANYFVKFRQPVSALLVSPKQYTQLCKNFTHFNALQKLSIRKEIVNVQSGIQKEWLKGKASLYL